MQTGTRGNTGCLARALAQPLTRRKGGKEEARASLEEFIGGDVRENGMRAQRTSWRASLWSFRQTDDGEKQNEIVKDGDKGVEKMIERKRDDEWTDSRTAGEMWRERMHLHTCQNSGSSPIKAIN